MIFRRNKKTNKRSKLPVTAVITYLLIAVILTTGVSFSRYSTVITGSDSARVAAFVFDVNEPSAITSTLGTIQAPGDHQIYEFQVTNKRGALISEVKESYIMTFETMGNLPLKFTLTEELTNGQSRVVPLTADASLSGRMTGEDGKTFGAAEVGEATYKLQVEWPENDNDFRYASGNGVATLRISMVAEQID